MAADSKPCSACHCTQSSRATASAELACLATWHSVCSAWSVGSEGQMVGTEDEVSSSCSGHVRSRGVRKSDAWQQ